MRLFILFCGFLLPIAAFAQTGTIGTLDEPVGPAAGASLAETIWNVVQMIAPIVMGSSIVSMFVKSEGGTVKTWIMRIVDFLALNWLRARNDPAVNK